MRQVPEEDHLEMGLGITCDQCTGREEKCEWLTEGRQQTCEGCHKRCIKCLVNKVSITNHADRVRKEPRAKWVKITSKAIIVESKSEEEVWGEKRW